MDRSSRSISRIRWAAVGAAVAVAVGAGGLMSASASIDSGERAVYVPITPCRVMDTRPATDNVGPRNTPIDANESYAITVRGTNGNCVIPADAAGLVMNVAAIAPTAPSFLTVFPSDVTRPLAANLNWLANDPPLSNAVTTDISADGRISFYNLSGTVHISADIVGYFVDHNHDDRYYPRAEVDAALALKASAAELQAAIAATPTAWGMARADGSLRAHSTNVVQVLHPGIGLYCVVFDPPVSGGRLEAATISGSGSGPVIGEKTNGIGGADSCTGAPGGNGLELRIYDQTGTLSDERFGFIVP